MLDTTSNGKLRAVVFDLDGVLVDSFEAWRLLFNSALEANHQGALTVEGFQAVWGQGVEADIKMFFQGLTAADLQHYYEENFERFIGGLLRCGRSGFCLTVFAAARLRPRAL